MLSPRPLTDEFADDGQARQPPLLWLLGIAGTAFLVRVTVAHQLSRTALFRAPQLDQLEFLTWARQLASGDLLHPFPPTHGPGYPYFLAVLLTVLLALFPQ